MRAEVGARLVLDRPDKEREIMDARKIMDDMYALKLRILFLEEALSEVEWDAGGHCNSCMGLRQHEDHCKVRQALEGDGSDD